MGCPCGRLTRAGLAGGATAPGPLTDGSGDQLRLLFTWRLSGLGPSSLPDFESYLLTATAPRHATKAALDFTAPRASWAPQYLLASRTPQGPGPMEEAIA